MWAASLKVLFEAQPMNQVLPNLWLGGIDAAKNVQQLESHGIGSVLTLDVTDRVGHRLARQQHLFVRIEDSLSSNLLEVLPACLDFLEQALENGGKALVHCMAGVSRSASVAAAFAMRRLSISAEHALLLLRRARPAVSPNASFVWQLSLFEQMRWTLPPDRLRLLDHLRQAEWANRRALPRLLSCEDAPAVSCASCALPLVRVDDLVPHVPLLNEKWSQKQPGDVACRCQQLVCLPYEWARPQILAAGADVTSLVCPGCSAKLGDFRWDRADLQPNCGAYFPPPVLRISAQSVTLPNSAQS